MTPSPIAKHNENVLFFKKINVIDDKKMDTLQHVMQEQTKQKTGLLPKYFMLICWEWKGILYKDLFSENQLILSNLTHPT